MGSSTRCVESGPPLFRATGRDSPSYSLVREHSTVGNIHTSSSLISVKDLAEHCAVYLTASGLVDKAHILAMLRAQSLAGHGRAVADCATGDRRTGYGG